MPTLSQDWTSLLQKRSYISAESEAPRGLVGPDPWFNPDLVQECAAFLTSFQRQDAIDLKAILA